MLVQPMADSPSTFFILPTGLPFTLMHSTNVSWVPATCQAQESLLGQNDDMSPEAREKQRRAFKPHWGGEGSLVQESQGWVGNCQADQRKGILGKGISTSRPRVVKEHCIQRTTWSWMKLEHWMKAWPTEREKKRKYGQEVGKVLKWQTKEL